MGDLLERAMEIRDYWHGEHSLIPSDRSMEMVEHLDEVIRRLERYAEMDGRLLVDRRR